MKISYYLDLIFCFSSEKWYYARFNSIEIAEILYASKVILETRGNIAAFEWKHWKFMRGGNWMLYNKNFFPFLGSIISFPCSRCRRIRKYLGNKILAVGVILSRRRNIKILKTKNWKIISQCFSFYSHLKISMYSVYSKCSMRYSRNIYVFRNKKKY